MPNIVLIQPEIPMNTGNIARTCAATGAVLHLVGSLGFDISAAAVKRAGLDYWHLVDIHTYASAGDFWRENEAAWRRGERLFYATTKVHRRHTDVEYRADDWLVFGRETKGLPEPLLAANAPYCVRIPMRPEARSLNLANSVAVVLYELLRQTGYDQIL